MHDASDRSIDELAELPAAGDRLIAGLERAIALDASGRTAEAHRTHLPLLRFAAAQVRMRLIPAVTAGTLAADPIQIALFGGTNTGKSTVANLLLGRAAAGMNVRARYSQHPEAFRAAPLGDAWLAAPSRFGRYRIYENERPPRYSDAELTQGDYQQAIAIIDPASLPAAPLADSVTTSAVLWDLPDFSTEEARIYLPAVLDGVALADLVIMTVTAESYADARGIALLGMIRDAGTPTLLVSNKTADSAELTRDIHEKLDAEKLAAGSGALEIHFLPHVEGPTPERRLAALLATHEAGELRQTLARLTGVHPARARNRLKAQSLAGALDFLTRHFETFIAPLADEARIARQWRESVAQATEAQLIGAYRRRYLDSEDYGEFRQTILRVMEQMEIPGISIIVRGIGDIIRAPLRLARGWLMGTGKEKRPLEHIVLQEAFDAWLATLKEQAQEQAQSTRLADWQELALRIDSESEVNRLRERFAERYGPYRRQMQEEIDGRAAEIVALIQKNPALKNTLKGLRLGTNLLTTGMAISSHGLDPSDFILAPIVSTATDWLWDALGKYYVEDQKRRLKLRQFELIRQLLTEALEAPAIALFPASVTQQDVDGLRNDFATVMRAAREVVEKESALNK